MKKIVMVVILGLLTNLIPLSPVMAQEKVQDKDSKHAEKIKKAVADAGPTLDREVIVKLKDNTEVRGLYGRSPMITLSSNQTRELSTQSLTVRLKSSRQTNGTWEAEAS